MMMGTRAIIIGGGLGYIAMDCYTVIHQGNYSGYIVCRDDCATAYCVPLCSSTVYRYSYNSIICALFCAPIADTLCTSRL